LITQITTKQAKQITKYFVQHTSKLSYFTQYAMVMTRLTYGYASLLRKKVHAKWETILKK